VRDTETTFESLEQSTPDFGDFQALTLWLDEGLQRLRELARPAALTLSVEPIEYAPKETAGVWGRYGDSRFRKFVAAAFLADIASYPEPVDQVGFERLMYVMHVFPRGFRVWGATMPDGLWLPVGYSGWYPIPETSFEILEQKTESVRDRMVVPLPTVVPEESYLYLFNFSIIEPLRRTDASRHLLRAFAEDITRQAARGLVAITVSAEGGRVVEQFQMKKTGTILIDGNEESVYTARRP
jgi:hypothetical protein